MLTFGSSTFPNQISVADQERAKYLGRTAGGRWARESADLETLYGWTVFHVNPFGPHARIRRLGAMRALIEEEVDAPEDIQDEALLELWRDRFADAALNELDMAMCRKELTAPLSFPGT